MDNIIEIDINEKYDFLDKYNEKNISSEFIEYIIKQALLVKSNEKIKVVINNKCDIEDNCTEYIKNGLKREYNKILEEYHNNTVKQLIFLVLGMLFIFLSTLIKDGAIWQEVLLIIGWVPIWEMIEVELFSDVDCRKRRKIVRKLLNSEFVEKDVEYIVKI